MLWAVSVAAAGAARAAGAAGVDAIPAGKVLWSTSEIIEPGANFSSLFYTHAPIVVPDTAFAVAVASDCSLNGIDIISGKVVWNLPPTDACMFPYDADDRLLLVDQNQSAHHKSPVMYLRTEYDHSGNVQLEGLVPATGKYTWTNPSRLQVDVGALAHVAYDSGLVLLAGQTGVAGVDAVEGTVRWTRPTSALNPDPRASDWFAGFAAAGAGLSFVGTVAGDNSIVGTLCALDTGDGSTLWQVNGTATEALLVPPSASSGGILLATMDRRPESTRDATGAKLVGIAVSSGAVLWTREDDHGDARLDHLALSAACLHDCALPCGLVYTSHFGIIDPATGLSTPYTAPAQDCGPSASAPAAAGATEWPHTARGSIVAPITAPSRVNYTAAVDYAAGTATLTASFCSAGGAELWSSPLPQAEDTQGRQQQLSWRVAWALPDSGAGTAASADAAAVAEVLAFAYVGVHCQPHGGGCSPGNAGTAAVVAPPGIAPGPIPPPPPTPAPGPPTPAPPSPEQCTAALRSLCSAAKQQSRVSCGYCAGQHSAELRRDDGCDWTQINSYCENYVH